MKLFGALKLNILVLAYLQQKICSPKVVLYDSFLINNMAFHRSFEEQQITNLKSTKSWQ